jgi:hypothetical protein
MLFVQMSGEDVEQEMRNWELTYGDSDGNLKDVADGAATATATGDAEKGKGNEVIDLEAEDKKRRPMAARSGMWDHFTKIYDDKGQLIKGKCNYCGNELGAHPVWNGTSATRKHFNTCKKNPYRAHDDANQRWPNLKRLHDGRKWTARHS